MTPIAIPPPSGSEALWSAPTSRRRVSAENDFEQPVLHDDRQPESDQQRREDVAAERPIEQHGLQRVAEREHQRHDDGAGDDKRHPCARGGEDQKCSEHDQIAMRQVDEAHDAENDREAGGIQRIEAAEQDSLQYRVHPAEHVPYNPK